MSVFAPETVAFDLVPPLAYSGIEAYRKQWDKLFASYEGAIDRLVETQFSCPDMTVSILARAHEPTNS
jgi:hypothetical protein